MVEFPPFSEQKRKKRLPQSRNCIYCRLRSLLQSFILNLANLKGEKSQMARSKRTSTIVETARQRLGGLKSITPTPDFGATLTVAGYEADITAVSNKLDQYNEMLSTLDALQNEFIALETALREKNTRMLSAAEAHYGPDSNEYEQVGGTRRSERKRTGPKGPRGGTPSGTPPTT